MASRATALERGFLIAGVVLVIAAPASAIVLAEEGPAYGLAETAPTPFVADNESSRAQLAVVCDWLPSVGSNGNCLPGETGNPDQNGNPANVPTQFNINAVGEAGALVFAAGGGENGSFVVTSPISGDVQSTTYVPCFLLGTFYPGEGSNVYSNCEAGGWVYSPRGTLSDSIVVFNVSTSEVTETIPLGTPAGCQPFDLAVSPVAQRLYCIGNGSELLTVDLSSQRLVSQIPLPMVSDPMETGLWFDPWAGSLILTLPGETWYELNPSNGTAEGTFLVPGEPDGLALSPRNDWAYVLWSRGTTSENQTSGISVVNLTTFTQVASVSIPWLGGGSWGDWFDRSGTEIYLGAGNHMYAFNTTTDSLLPGAIYLGYWVSEIESVSYVPGTDSFVVSSCAAYTGVFPTGECVLNFIPVVHGTTTYPPFSAVAYVGTAFPLDLGVVGFFCGVACLVTYGLLGRRRFWSEPPGSD
jgi:hypothetical protein